MILTDADFLSAILAHPFDDSPRLIYAEWLEDRAHESGGGERRETCDGKGWGDDDNGDEWRCLKCHGTGRIPDTRAELAEFIRLQCEMTEHPASVELYQRYADQWFAGSIGGAFYDRPDGYIDSPYGIVRRGFISIISCTLAAFMQHAAEIFSKHPVTDVRLTDREPGGRHIGWNGRTSQYTPDELPIELCDRLRYYVREAGDWRWYPTSAAAHIALSHACVDYGRSIVGLPPLNRPPETERSEMTA